MTTFVHLWTPVVRRSISVAGGETQICGLGIGLKLCLRGPVGCWILCVIKGCERLHALQMYFITTGLHTLFFERTVNTLICNIMWWKNSTNSWTEGNFLGWPVKQCIQAQIAVPGKTTTTWHLRKNPVPALSVFLTLSLKQSVLMRIRLRPNVIRWADPCITHPGEILKRWHQAAVLSLTTKTASTANAQQARSSHEVVKQGRWPCQPVGRHFQVTRVSG